MRGEHVLLLLAGLILVMAAGVGMLRDGEEELVVTDPQAFNEIVIDDLHLVPDCTVRGISLTGSWFDIPCDDDAFLELPQEFVLRDESGPYLDVVTNEGTRYKLRLERYGNE